MDHLKRRREGRELGLQAVEEAAVLDRRERLRGDVCPFCDPLGPLFGPLLAHVDDVQACVLGKT
jgi:hypothetical protein